MPGVAEAATFVGLAGTVTTVAAVELGLADYDRDAIHHFVSPRTRPRTCSAPWPPRPRAERIHNPGLEEARADVIVGGCCVLVAIMRHFGFRECLVSRGRHPRRPRPQPDPVGSLPMALGERVLTARSGADGSCCGP